MVQKRVQVSLKNGLQARPAALFVQEANRFHDNIYIEKDGNTVNAKSIMGIMSLAIGTGSMITITTEGSDAEEALEAGLHMYNKKLSRMCDSFFVVWGLLVGVCGMCILVPIIVGKSISCVETSIY